MSLQSSYGSLRLGIYAQMITGSRRGAFRIPLLCLLPSSFNMSFGRPPQLTTFSVLPPDRGSFPLDHDGQSDASSVP